MLERNFSPQVAARYKRAALSNVVALTRLVAARLPELGEHDAGRFAAATVLVTGAIRTHAPPSPAMRTAYQADPTLAAMRLYFTDTLREVGERLGCAKRSRPIDDGCPVRTLELGFG